MYGRIKQIQWNIVELPGLETYGSHCPFSLKRMVSGIGEEWASLVLQVVKNPPAVQETQVQSLGQEDPLVKEMATHSSILARTEEPGELQCIGSQRVRHDWVINTHIIWRGLHNKVVAFRKGMESINGDPKGMEPRKQKPPALLSNLLQQSFLLTECNGMP